MPAHFFLRGLGIGFAIAAPVGPIGVLCIRRSLADGRRIGLATGLGAATADAAYGCIAGFGLASVSGFLVAHRLALNLVGGLFLCCLGLRTFAAKPAAPRAAPAARELYPAYVSTLFYTLCNPMTLLSFVALFAGLGLATSPDYGTAGWLVAGVFVGSASWWLMLSSGVSSFRSKISYSWMQNVNRLSGVVIFTFGLLALATSWSLQMSTGG